MLIKLIGILILLACFAGAIFLIVLLIAFVGFDQAQHNHLFPFSIIENAHANRIYVTAFLTAFIPVVTIILVIITAIFNTKSIGRSTGVTLLILWLFSLGFFVYYAARATANFRESASFTQTTNLKATPGNVYYLKYNNVKYLTHDDSLRLNIKDHFHGVILNNDDDYNDPRNVSINIERSDIPQPVLVESFTARGHDYEDALTNARNTKYIFVQQDSVLKFDDMLRRMVDESWHEEELQLTLKLPLNAKVVIDQELANRINLNGINVGECNTLDKHENAASAAFIMTNDGLQCKIDTVVIIKTKAQIDSARRADSLQTAEL